MRRSLLAAAVLASLSLAAPAYADNYVVKDGLGALQTLATKLVNGVHYPIHLLYGLFGASPTPIAVDGSGNVGVNVQNSTLPSGASTATNQTAVQATPGSDASKAQAVQGVTGGKAVATAPAYGASGVTATTCTITTAATCAAPTLIAGRDFHVSHKLTGFTGSCQWERQVDGTNWYVVTVTAGGSTTQMYNWSFSASTKNISEDISEPQVGVAQRLNCTSASAGSDVVTISQ